MMVINLMLVMFKEDINLVNPCLFGAFFSAWFLSQRRYIYKYWPFHSFWVTYHEHICDVTSLVRVLRDMKDRQITVMPFSTCPGDEAFAGGHRWGAFREQLLHGPNIPPRGLVKVCYVYLLEKLLDLQNVDKAFCEGINQTNKQAIKQTNKHTSIQKVSDGSPVKLVIWTSSSGVLWNRIRSISMFLTYNNVYIYI